MTQERPDFIDSPYFVGEVGNWHLKEGAPEEVVREFNEFMREGEAPEDVETILERMEKEK